MADPSFPVATNDIVEVRINGACHGSTVMTVLHYMLDSVSPTSNDGWAILGEMIAGLTGIGSLFSEYLGCLSNQWQWRFTDYQVIFATRWIARRDTPADVVNGSVVSPALPLATSGRILKKAITGSRHARGVIHMPAVPTSFATDDSLTADAITAYQGFAATVKATVDLSAISAGTKAIPVLFNRAAPIQSKPIFDTVVEEPLGTERRRLPGRGI